MVRKPIPDKASTKLSTAEVRAAIPKIRKRLEEIRSLDIRSLDNESGGHILDSFSTKINATLRDIFPVNSVEYHEYNIDTLQPRFSVYYSEMDSSLLGNIDQVRDRVGKAISQLSALLEILEEKIEDSEPDSDAKAIRAYSELDLHPEISRASTKLYRDGHYSNGIEAAVKALNALVRLRSGLELDGTALMERAFSPKNPVLKFNSLADQSDLDEQKGFMQLFSGAVSGLRNPRAHSFIQDDPERALEFIAFVSLLAKLLDEAEHQ